MGAVEIYQEREEVGVAVETSRAKPLATPACVHRTLRPTAGVRACCARARVGMSSCMYVCVSGGGRVGARAGSVKRQKKHEGWVMSPDAAEREHMCVHVCVRVCVCVKRVRVKKERQSL